MRVLFFISLLGHGRGGHVHSLSHISSEIAKIHDVAIISIGSGDNSTISKSPNYIAHFNFNGINILGLKLKINSFLKEYNPDILHFFDARSYSVVSPLYNQEKFKTVVTKCGGPNPKQPRNYPFINPLFPLINNLIVFSMENKTWFENSPLYKNSNIALIPNRVAKIHYTPLDITKPKDSFCFVKIARIGPTYKDSILDAINLIDTLYKDNDKLKLKLFIIGTVEDHKVLEDISSNKYVSDGTVKILTQDKYTKEASKLLYLADAAIATGRGVMEAASMKKPVLTINSKSRVPALLSKNTFKEAFKTNFSERNTFPSLDESENLLNIHRLITDDIFYKEISEYMGLVFDQYFDIKKAKYEYDEFYKSIPNNAVPKLYTIYTLLALHSFFKKSFNQSQHNQ